MAVSRPCPIDTFDDLDRIDRDVEGDIDERAVEGDTRIGCRRTCSGQMDVLKLRP